MKKLIKIFGIIAFIAIVGFSMTACDDDSIDGNNNSGGNSVAEAADVTVTNNDIYGGTIIFSIIDSTGSVYSTSTAFNVSQSRTLRAPAGDYRIRVTTASGFGFNFHYPSGTVTTYMSGTVRFSFNGSALVLQ